MGEGGVAQFAEGSACPLMGGSCAETQCKARWMVVHLERALSSPPLSFSLLLSLASVKARQYRDRQDLKAEQDKMNSGVFQKSSCPCCTSLIVLHSMAIIFKFGRAVHFKIIQ